MWAAVLSVLPVVMHCSWQHKVLKPFVEHLLKRFNRLQELIAEYEVHELVVGMPKNMNGTKGERAEKTEEFVEKMKEVIDLPVSYWDERLSTVMAERQLIAADVSRKKRKSVIDKMAAVVILQGYLDRLQFNK